MKFVIPKAELVNLINKLQNVVPQKPAIPILSNILIEAKDHQITLSATDLTVGIRCTAEAKISEEGTTTLPAKRFFSLVRELTAAQLEISSQNDAIEVVANSSRFKLLGTDAKEYPSLPNFAESISFTMKQSELKEMLFRTAFAVSREDSRYVLTGVCVQIAQGTAVFIGTNGKCLARTYTPLEIDPAFSGSYIIPLKAVEEVLKILSEGDQNVKVSLMSDKIAFEANAVILITKLLTGEYPDVSRVIPGHSEWKIALHREELISLLRQISLFLEDPSRSARFSLCNGELKLSANSADIGEGKVSMPANYAGPELEIAFNPGFFLDILRHSKAETVTLGLSDPFNPGLIVDKDSQEFSSNASPLFVLMPMRLND